MTPDDDDLAADLRGLFADQGLAVPVGEDAVASVVAGAKRRRRRRTTLLATGGALGVAAVLLAGGLFAGRALPPGQVQTGSQPGLPISSQPSTPEQLAPRPAPPRVNLPANEPTVLGPTGYGDLFIGMTGKQAMGTGLVNTQDNAVAGCSVYTYLAPTQSRPSAAAATGTSIKVYVSPRAQQGVQEIIAPPGVLTPEGVGVGSQASMIRTDYPDLPARKGNVQLAPVPGQLGLSYRFTVDSQGTVVSIGLGRTDEACLGY
ncbi:MAG TPA: hypothetical protein VJ914_21130 [Pseudonocardiaceae bacterium]|nr:hypothetical protein [Pseudonocardiaceae bacterium]